MIFLPVFSFGFVLLISLFICICIHSCFFFFLDTFVGTSVDDLECLKEPLGSVVNILCQVYPSFEWEVHSLKNAEEQKRANQGEMEKQTNVL